MRSGLFFRIKETKKSCFRPLNNRLCKNKRGISWAMLLFLFEFLTENSPGISPMLYGGAPIAVFLIGGINLQASRQNCSAWELV